MVGKAAPENANGSGKEVGFQVDLIYPQISQITQMKKADTRTDWLRMLSHCGRQVFLFICVICEICG